jgi:hypothetical protein
LPSTDAGLAAGRAHAFAEAARHYRRALELWERVPDSSRPTGLDRIDLLRWLAEAIAFTGRIDRAVVCLEDAVDRVDPIAESHRAAKLPSLKQSNCSPRRHRRLRRLGCSPPTRSP